MNFSRPWLKRVHISSGWDWAAVSSMIPTPRCGAPPSTAAASGSVLGSPSVRQHVSGVHGLKPDVALASESLGALSEYGSKRGVIVNLENDNPVAEDPFFLVDVIERVKSPWLRALPDFGNSLLAHDHEYNRRALTKMFQHAYSMSHVKDSVLAEDGKVSTVDLAAIFGIAKAAGYRGYFSMECETGLSGPFAGTEKLVQESLKYLK